MPDMSFDVVYAGGGHGAMMSAPYLGMNGLSVGVFEMLPELGGGHCTEPRPLPGFIGNPCASMLLTFMAPQVQDFKLYEKGLELILPEYPFGCVWDDGTGWAVKRAMEWDPKTGIQTIRKEIVEENMANIAKINSKDAKNMAEISRKMTSSWGPAMMQYGFNPPPPPGEKDALEMLMDGSPDGIPERWTKMNIVQIMRELLEDPRLIMYCTRISLAAGIWPDEVPPLSMAMQVAVGPSLGIGTVSIAKNGTHQVIHAAQRALFEVGGQTFANCEVDEIVVENGKAKGIKLTDGSFIEAKKMVICNIEPRQFLHRLLRNFKVDPQIIKDMDEVPANCATLLWGDVAFHERPKYIAEEFCPEIAKVGGFLVMGDSDIDYVEKKLRYENQSIRPGKWPEKMYFWENPKSLMDPGQAPPGKHISLVEDYGPPASAMTEREWAQVRRELPGILMENWRKFAPNMTDDNMIGFEIDTPGDFQFRNRNLIEGGWAAGVMIDYPHYGRRRPIPQLAHHKVPGIESLYLGGSQTTHGGALGSSCDASYCMYKTIAKDFGLRKFWEEAGRPY